MPQPPSAQSGWTPQLRETYQMVCPCGQCKKGARLANYLADIKRHATEAVLKQVVRRPQKTVF